MCDPDDLPHDSEPLATLEVKADSVPPHFTHITVNGCNILGLVNVFTVIGVLFLLNSGLLPDNRALKLAVFIFCICGCCGGDFVSRLRSDEGGRLYRLLSPHAGGAIFFIPAWAIYPAMAIAAAVAVAFQKR